MGCGGSSQNNAQQPVQNPRTIPPAQTQLQRPAPAQPAVQQFEDSIQDEEEIIDDELERELLHGMQTHKGTSRPRVKKQENEEKMGEFLVEPPESGDHMLAVKPWVGAIKPPSNPPQVNNNPPQASLELEYAFGYRCFDTRNNVFYTQNQNKIVYMVAAIGVVLDKTNNTQQFFGAGPQGLLYGHTDDITSLAVHPNRDIVATGEVGKNPKVCIWSISDPSKSIIEFRQGRDSRAVASLSFSHDGRYLASSDLHNEHEVRVWEWQNNGKLIFQDKGGPDKILDLVWSSENDQFCTVGVKHIYFWTNVATGFKKQRGIFGKSGAPTTMTSVGWLRGGSSVTGGANGMLYSWGGASLIKVNQTHGKNQAIHAVKTTPEFIFSGGRDNVVRISNHNLQQTREIQVGSCPRAIDVVGNDILCGMRNGQIIEIRGDSINVLMNSHCDGEVWGVCLDPSNPNRIASVADDNSLRVWDIREHRQIIMKTLEAQPGPQRRAGEGASTLASNTPKEQARAVCINPTNGHVAIGHNDGHYQIFQSIDNLTSPIKVGNEPKEWIEAMQYNPDGSKLAIGSHDNFIYVFDVGQNYRLKHRLRGHSSFIIALDWSVDGQSLHSNCGAYELLFWDANSGVQIKDGATRFRDEEWATWSAKLGWPVQGIFGGVVDMTHVNTVDRAHNMQLVAVGNDWGFVELFNYPNGDKAKSNAFRAHSEHVMNVKFSQDDRYVFSAGGYDQTIMQWRVIR